MPEESDLERLGGRTRLEELISVFIDRVTSDPMIGFLFRNVNKDVLKAREVSFAASHLGGGPYEGRPLRDAHTRHRIMGGQFNRRLVLLEKTLREFNVPEDIRERWLEHTRALRAEITRDGSDECVG
ncbi:MAG: hypothetical protein B6A08_16045 [Sorangiineae bacterium NIC37A_2]|jgi:truncated hemoglobin YjbI|nr:MAG: hypothetical protein B6A08_16045 [Sorangiineae bacterium NIC37A_2]